MCKLQLQLGVAAFTHSQSPEKPSQALRPTSIRSQAGNLSKRNLAWKLFFSGDHFDHLSLQHLHLAANIRVESCLGRVSCRLGVGESVWAKFAICGLIWGPVSSLQVSVWLSHRTIHHLHNDHQTISNPPQKLSVCQFCQSSASMMWVFL